MKLILFICIIISSFFAYKRLKPILKKKQAEHAFKYQVADTLDALGQSLEAGYSLPQSLEFVAESSQEPMKSYLQSHVIRLQYGFSVNKVLSELKASTQDKHMILALDHIEVQNKIGGNIIEVLKKLATYIREKQKLENDIKSQTAQGRFSGLLICLLLPFSLIIFKLLSPQYINVMFETFVGNLLLLIAIILEIIGFRLIYKITNVEL